MVGELKLQLPAPEAAGLTEADWSLETFGFDLNNREVASLIYIGLIVAALVIWPKGRAGLGGVAKAAFQPKLVLIYGLMSFYVFACTALLKSLNVWDWSNLKTTLLWWLTAGFGAVFKANELGDKKDAARRLLRDILTWTAVITFVAEVHSLPLIWELILLPILAVVGMMLSLSQMNREHAILVTPLTWILSIVGLFLLLFSIRGIILDPADFFEWHQLREFADPLLLSAMFIPFLIGLATFMAYESLFVSLNFTVSDAGLRGYTKRRAITAFGLDTDGARRLTRAIRLNDVRDRSGVDREIAMIKRLKAVEASPPPVDPKEGWSPYVAGSFLAGFGLSAQDYHRTLGSWWSEASPIKLTDRAFSDRALYYVSGVEHAATRLRLVVDVSYQNDTDLADEAFRSMAATLLSAVLPMRDTDGLLERVCDDADQEAVVDGLSLKSGIDVWGIDRKGGYRRNLVVLHPAHVATDMD